MVAKAKEIDGFDKDTIYQDLKKENRKGECPELSHFILPPFQV